MRRVRLLTGAIALLVQGCAAVPPQEPEGAPQYGESQAPNAGSLVLEIDECALARD